MNDKDEKLLTIDVVWFSFTLGTVQLIELLKIAVI